MQEELIEMLEEIIQYVEVCNAHDQGIVDKAGALVEKAKNSAKEPAVPQGKPVLVQHRKPIVGKDGETIGYTSWIDGNGLDWWPHRSLYATQSQPVTLTDEVFHQCVLACGFTFDPRTGHVWVVDGGIGTSVTEKLRKFATELLSIAALREKEGK